MPSHTNSKVSLGASIPVASSRFQSVIRHFPELGTASPFIGLPPGIGRALMCRSCSLSCPFISAMSISGPRKCT